MTLEMYYNFYDNIGPLIMKIESIVLSTNGGKSTLMCKYFEYWEKIIYLTLHQMVINNVQQFFRRLNSESVPLFSITVHVNESNAIVCQPVLEVIPLLAKENVEDLLQTLKYFKRWTKGTCLHCEQFTFFDDISGLITVTDELKSITVCVSNLMSRASQYLTR